MGIDIRWPIALLFTIYGLILVVAGAVADPASYERSLGVNIDLWWGAAMLVFAAFMGALAFRASRPDRS
ncbi:MAG: hypothetical protein HYS33_02310 [Acidobacteria bacterium]|nr:hypothetical protein [Acidobacteriota bacterium]MBI1983916.1 hypothetical protein [Acidobacteriota bacterium]